MPADPQRVRSLFLELVEHVPPAEWPARLAAACGDDTVLRRRVQALLDAHEVDDPLLDLPDPPPPTLDHPGPLGEGTVIGPYKLLQRLGAGGMGEVWVAQQKQPVQRLVALKIIKPGMDSRQVIARFEAEEQALALMDHPNIARVFDAGTTPSGHPYFAMELVKGVPITQYCDEHQLTVRQRLELFLPVCQAVQHAHQKGIIHRDLKPSNVLIAEYDETPVAKVIDFGIAKALGPRLTDKTIFTEVGTVIGTLEYMSPEQAKLNQLDVDTRSDVYALGVLLYELLTGTTPFDRTLLKAAALDEMLRTIREVDPPRPSARLSASQTLPTVAARRHAQPADLPKQVQGELDWIVMTALDKERKRRYQSAASLAEDIQHHLHDEPVKACPPSVSYRFRKFARRYRWPVAAGTALLTALVLGAVGTSLGMFQAFRSARNEAQARLREKELSTSLRQQLYVSDMGEARQAWESGQFDRLEMLLRRHVPVSESEDNRGFEWFYLWRLWRRESNLRFFLPERGIYSAYRMALSADGSVMAVAHARGSSSVTVLDLVGGKPPRPYGHPGSGYLVDNFAALSKDGSTLAYRTEEPGKVLIRDLNTGTERVIVLEGDVKAVAFSPDGQQVALGCAGGALCLWDLRTWQPRSLGRGPDGHTGDIKALAYFPHTGCTLVTAGADCSLRAWDLVSGRLLWKGEGHEGLVFAVAVSPDENFVAAASADRTVTVWHPVTGRRLHTLVGGRDEVRAVAFSADGRLLAGASRDSQIRLWNVDGFTQREVISGFDGVRALAFLPNGTLVFGSQTGGIASRPLQTAEYPDILPPPRPAASVQELVFLPDGKALLTYSPAHQKQLRHIQVTADGVSNAEPLPVDCRPWALAVSTDSLVAVGDQFSPAVFLYRYGPSPIPWNRQARLEAGGTSGVRSAAFSPSGKRLAVGQRDGTVTVWDVSTREVVFHTAAHQHEVAALAFCGDEETLLTGGMDQRAIVWDLRHDSPRHDLGPQTDWVVSAAASHEGQRFAVGVWANGSYVRVWHRDDAAELATLRGHRDAPNKIAFLQGGRTLVSAAADRTLRLWDLNRREQRFVFDGGTSIFHSLAVSPDQRILAAGARDGTIRLYRAATCEEVRAVPGWWRRTDGDDAP